MDKHKLDTDIKELFENSKNYYGPLAREAKSRIWNTIQNNAQEKFNTPLVKILTIACILLIMFSSILSVSLFNSRRTFQNLAELHKELIEKPLENKTNSPEEKIYTADTVFITKVKFVDRPVAITRTLTDTVYLKEIVYVPENNLQTTNNHKEYNDDFVFEKSIEDTLIYTSEVFIQNLSAKQPAKERKINFRIFNTRENTHTEQKKFAIEL
jgi:hypothetical protein